MVLGVSSSFSFIFLEETRSRSLKYLSLSILKNERIGQGLSMIISSSSQKNYVAQIKGKDLLHSRKIVHVSMSQINTCLALYLNENFLINIEFFTKQPFDMCAFCNLVCSKFLPLDNILTIILVPNAQTHQSSPSRYLKKKREKNPVLNVQDYMLGPSLEDLNPKRFFSREACVICHHFKPNPKLFQIGNSTR